jgi:hypothetical protein
MLGQKVESVIGKLEGGFALVYSSGLAAVNAVLYRFKPKTIWMNGGYKGYGVVILIENNLTPFDLSSSQSVFANYLKLIHSAANWFDSLKLYNEV